MTKYETKWDQNRKEFKKHNFALAIPINGGMYQRQFRELISAINRDSTGRRVRAVMLRKIAVALPAREIIQKRGAEALMREKSRLRGRGPYA